MDTSHLPPETPASAARRRELSRQWDAGAAFAQRMAVSSEQVEQLRRSGRLLGVWIAEENVYRYPGFQLNQDGSLIAEVAPILALLRTPIVTGGHPVSGWEELEWLLAPNPWLERRAPAACLAAIPERVLAVATQQLLEDADSRW